MKKFMVIFLMLGFLLACDNQKQRDKNSKILLAMFPNCEIWVHNEASPFLSYVVVCKDYVFLINCGFDDHPNAPKILEKK